MKPGVALRRKLGLTADSQLCRSAIRTAVWIMKASPLTTVVSHVRSLVSWDVIQKSCQSANCDISRSPQSLRLRW